MLDYPISEFDDDVNLVFLDHDAGNFEVNILRVEINKDWNTQTYVCKITEPFILYNGESEYYTTAYNYIVFQTNLDNRPSGRSVLFEKAKDANKFYIQSILRLDVN